MMKNITYIFNTNGTTFKNTIAGLLGERTINCTRIGQEIVIFIYKTEKKNLTFLTL